MDEPQAIGARQLKGKDAPRVLEHPDLAIGTRRLDALLQVDLVEAEGRDPGLRWPESDVRLELLHRRQGGQRRRIVDQVPERDERVRLAAAVVDGKLAVRLVAAAGEPVADVLDQLPEVQGGEGEGEKLVGLLVHRPLSLLHDNVVQVGGEDGQGQLPRLQVVAQLHDLVPGFPGCLGCHVVLISLASSRS